MKIQPWLAPPPAADSVDDFLVVGAGVAGAAVARTLAERGSQVRVLDKQAPASSASGNPAAVIRPVLARSLDDPLARFYSDAFAVTKSRILTLVQAGHTIAHAFDGVLHCHPQAEALRGAATHEYWPLEKARAELGDSAQAGGCWLPEAGWVSPRHYTNALLTHPSIELMLGRLATLDHDGLRWRLFDSEGSCLASAENVVLTNGWQLIQLAPTEFLPVNPVVSQLLHFQAQYSQAGPAVPVVGGGTIIPSDGGWMATAGHWHDTTDDNVEVGRNAEILRRCGGIWQMPAQAGDANLRAAVRGTSRDYLPMVGGVPDSALCRELYDDLCHGRPAHHYPEPPYLPGLYVLGALGGRGITSAQFCAEVLCATVFGETHPWQLGLHPLRFMARDLKHGHAKS